MRGDVEVLGRETFQRTPVRSAYRIVAPSISRSYRRFQIYIAGSGPGIPSSCFGTPNRLAPAVNHAECCSCRRSRFREDDSSASRRRRGDTAPIMRPPPLLEWLARSLLSPPLARRAKIAAAGMRHRLHRRACRRGWVDHGHRYPHHLLFVAGLPKAGTTWVERMLASVPGYGSLLIPEVNRHELRHGSSHDFELPSNFTSRFDRMLVVTKMHVHGSIHNCRVLRAGGVPYAIVHRDLRDVAVSHVHYVRSTPWHPEHSTYAALDVMEGLRHFGETLLAEYAEWVRSWHRNRDPASSTIVSYEEMLEDASAALSRIVKVFELPLDADDVDTIVEAHSFGRMSGGRRPGEEQARAFVRSGTTGGWRRHFTTELEIRYRETLGDFPTDLGLPPLDW